MLTRMLQTKIEKINQTDSEQATDISGLKTDVGEVPTGEGNDLQSQITAIKADIGEVTSGEGNDLQSQITALELRVAAIEPEGD